MAITLIYTQPVGGEEILDENGEVIGRVPISIQDGFSLAALKNTIHLKYDRFGNCDTKSINLGIKNEHRVTWIYFNLVDLLWNQEHIKNEHESQLSTKEWKNLYNLYNFKLVFKTKNGKLHSFFLNTDKLSGSEVVFEVPRILTQYPGETFKMILIIEENINSSNQNNYQHNIPDSASEITTNNLDASDTTFEDENKKNKKVQITYAQKLGTPPHIVERFITKEIKVSVKDGIYNGEGLVVNNLLLDTNQYDSLIKPSLFGKLTDNGTLSIETAEGEEATNLGRELDSYVKYIKFDSSKITAHIGELKKYLFFRHQINDKYEIAYSPLERLTDTLHDDYEENSNYNYISWIPAKVFEYPGKWEICLVAFAGNVPVKPTHNEWKDEQLSYDFEAVNNRDYYYCYISKTIIMEVEDSFLTKTDFDNLKEWNPGYNWDDIQDDENGNPVLDENGDPVIEDNIELTQDYVDYSEKYQTLMLNNNQLRSTPQGLQVNLREFNINTSVISYINGCEIVDKEAREEINNLSSSGIASMGKAFFSGEGQGYSEDIKNFTEIHFKYQFGPENGSQEIWKPENNPYLNRMYAFQLKYNGNANEAALVKLFCEFTKEVSETGEPIETSFKSINLIIPKIINPTIKDLKNHFVYLEETNTWYFSGYFIEKDENLYLITTADSGIGSGSGTLTDADLEEIYEAILSLDNRITQLKRFNDEWHMVDYSYQEHEVEDI